MNLRMPHEDDGPKRDQAWKALLDGLFAWLQQALVKGERLDFAALQRDLGTWEEFVNWNDERRNLWDAARSMLWCAAYASTIPSPNWDDIDRISLVIANIPELQGHEGWALDCMRLLRRASASQFRSRRVPVALSTLSVPGEGNLAMLVLEVLKPGGGQVFLHPEDTLRTRADHDFIEALQAAWEAAKALVAKKGGDVAFDGRWRVLRPDGQPLQEIRGSSASGAVALGWYRALTDTCYDDRIIVLAGIDPQGKLGPVSGVTAKVQAIAQDGRFDTIVVADDANQREAEATLRKLGKSGAIRVVYLR